MLGREREPGAEGRGWRDVPERERRKTRRLDTEAGLAPVSALGVVPVVPVSVPICSILVLSIKRVMVWRGTPFVALVPSLDRRSIIPNGVTGAETNPLGNRPVLLLRFGELLLRAESLVALFRRKGKLSAHIFHDSEFATPRESIA